MLFRPSRSTKLQTAEENSGVDAELREQFEYEREAAIRLRSAPSHERRELYRQIYDEFYRRFGSSEHMAEGESSNVIQSQLEFVRRFVKTGRDDFVELGSGSSKLCIEIASSAKTCIGIDTTGRVVPDAPANCTFMVDDVVGFSLPDNSVDIAFSSQVLSICIPTIAKS